MKNIITKLFIVINDSDYLINNKFDSSSVEDIKDLLEINFQRSSIDFLDSLRHFKLSNYEFRNDWKYYSIDPDRIKKTKKLVSYYQRLN